ncbi:MAG: competence/damage-inducible protein A [Bryobacteraceae bacterium]
MFDAEIIAVGSELLTHDRLDTNSLFVTEQLNGLGVEVRRKMVIGDDRALLAAAIRNALSDMSLVVVTGGLGPTEDDVTRDAVASALGRNLILSPQVQEWIEERFRRLNRKMAEINLRQAYLIEGAEAIRNPRGTAPGQWIECGGRVIILLPGPPGELKPLFTSECLPHLQCLLPPQVICARCYRVAGMGESDLDTLIAPVYKKFHNPATTILAGAGDIQVHLRAHAETIEEAEKLLCEVCPGIEQLLGDRIYSHNGDSLEAVVGAKLAARHATLSVAESCTGGMVAGRITSVPGSGDYFVGGMLVYTDPMKTALLGVPADMIEKHTAVSEEVARAMAQGARERTGSSYALSVTGEAGPESATGAPPGTVFIGLAEPDGSTEVRELHLGGERNRVRMLASQHALDFLRRKIS